MKTRFQPHDVTQRGSALLLSLGILSLVLILAMSFAYTSNTRLNIAKSQGSSSDARVLADKIVQLVMSDMRHLFEATTRDKTTTPDTDSDKTYYATIYPPESMVSTKVGTTVTNDNAYNQDLMLFQRYNYYQNYAVSHNNVDVSTEYPDVYLGERLGLCYNGQWIQYTGKFDDDKYGYPILSDLPQLAPIAGDLKMGLSFAPPLVLNYTDSDGVAESESKSKVVGRYGYVLLDETNKLSINSLLNLTDRTPAATYDFAGVMRNGGKYCDRLALRQELDNVNMANDSYYGFDTSKRRGLIPEEIGAKDDYLNQLKEFPEGSKARIGWQSNDQLCAKVTDFYNSSEHDIFVYTPLSMQDIEAWWDEAGKKEMARFDLTGASWGMSSASDTRLQGQVDAVSLTLDPAKTAWAPPSDPDGFTQAESEDLIRRLAGYKPKPTDKEPASSSEDKLTQLAFWDTNGEPNYSVEKTTNDATSCVGYLDWLQYMVDDDGNSVTLDVAANIKDYSDTDSYASTDFAPTATVEADLFKEPLFCGNEKVAYINEVALKSDFARDADGNYNVRIYGAVELLNLYCNPKDCSVTECTVPAGHVKVKYTGKLKVFKQTFKYVLKSTEGDGGSTGDGSTGGEWQPAPSAEGGDITELGTYDMTGIQELSSASDDWYSFSDGEEAPRQTGILKPAHLGYNTIYIKKILDWSALKTLCRDMPATAMEDGMKIESAPVIDVTTRTIYSFYVVFDKCVAYTYKGDTEYEMDSLYDVASLELDGNKNYCVDTKKKNEDYFGDVVGADGNISPTYPGTPGFFKEENITVDFESTDSRCNHRNAGGKFWTVNKWKEVKGSIIPPAQTLDKDNTDSFRTNPDPTASVDMESGVKFSDDRDKPMPDEEKRTYSTAYIRNAPMRSLWELGAIHRGYPNQTINLKQFTEKADWATPNKVTYAEGDAGMLDQVKIGPLLFVEGKVNANMRNPLVWKKLLEGIANGWYEPSGADFTVFNLAPKPADPDYTKPADPDYTTLDDGSAWSGLARPTSYSRGAVAKMLQNVLTATNDRDWEAYIGKTAQLLTTRCELYSLLVYAESLEDITEAIAEATGGEELSEELKKDLEPVLGKLVDVKTAENDTHYCKVKGSQKILVHLQRDAWRKVIKMIDRRYLEE